MTALHAADYLSRLARRPHTLPRDTPRDGLQALLARMGHPERGLRSVHIAGSKGKGSTALMLDAMLRAGGRRVGVFSSPHVERWNERIRLDGEPVDDARFDAILDELRPHVAALHDECERGPDFFEVLLVAALCLFRQAEVDEAIIEAGIGVRFDATMVVQPVVTALTSIELEHTAVLGPSLAAIAADKAAIARPQVPLVTGSLPAPARAVVTERARQVGAPLLTPLARMTDTAHAIMDNGPQLALPAPSQALADCAAIAWGCLQALDLFVDNITVAQTGMAALTLPGRQEVLAQVPLLVADSAHTAASVAALVEALQAWGVAQRPLTLVLSCSGQRNPVDFAASLLALAVHVVVTQADAVRSAEPRQLAAAIRPHCAPGVPVEVIAAPAAALVRAREQTPAHGMICATGSVYMAGAARRCLAMAGR